MEKLEFINQVQDMINKLEKIPLGNYTRTVEGAYFEVLAALDTLLDTLSEEK